MIPDSFALVDQLFMDSPFIAGTRDIFNAYPIDVREHSDEDIAVELWVKAHDVVGEWNVIDSEIL